MAGNTAKKQDDAAAKGSWFDYGSCVLSAWKENMKDLDSEHLNENLAECRTKPGQKNAEPEPKG